MNDHSTPTPVLLVGETTTEPPHIQIREYYPITWSPDESERHIQMTSLIRYADSRQQIILFAPICGAEAEAANLITESLSPYSELSQYNVEIGVVKVSPGTPRQMVKTSDNSYEMENLKEIVAFLNPLATLTVIENEYMSYDPVEDYKSYSVEYKGTISIPTSPVITVKWFN